MNYTLSKRSMGNLIGIHPQLSFAITEAIKITKQDFGILNSGGVRTNSEQKKLYAQGRTQQGSKVTWTLDSMHQYGLAADLVAYQNNKFTWNEKYYKEIAKAMKAVIKTHSLNIDYGFDLWGRDKAHWQMTGMKSQYDIRKLNYC